MIPWLRALAAALAIAALIDPAWHVRRRQRLPIDVVTGAPSQDTGRIQKLVEGVASRSTGAPPAAVILVAPVDPGVRIPDGVPVSVVDPPPVGAPNVRVVSAIAPSSVIPGEELRVTADLEADGMAGRTSTVVLEQAGVAVARTEHRWAASPERFRATLAYAPPSAGVIRMRIVAAPAPGESSDRDNAADLTVAVAARTLRVLVHEPRPSWAAAFLRRSLESDPAFDVAATTSLSRGPAVRAGSPPRRLTAQDLETFDAVVVGAPEALSAPEVAALDSFARVRGGGVLLLPDRRPSGTYLTLLPASRFDEMLLDRPAVITTGAILRAAEIAAPSDAGRAAAALATIEQGTTRRAVVVSWPRGAGRVVFSGALDAWRYRASDEDGFGRFWQALVAGLAEAAPPRIAVRVDPGAAAPGDPITVRVAVRGTEVIRDAAGSSTPPVAAEVIAPDGSTHALRVWPTAEEGIFEGRLPAPAAGRYDIRASLPGKAAADVPLVVSEHADRPGGGIASATLDWIVASTGGVRVSLNDPSRLESHLRSLPAPDAIVEIHPLRSPWVMLPFAGVLTSVWALGRRRGLP